MPFITDERRGKIVMHESLDWQPGDHCYEEYLPLAQGFKRNPRWTMVDWQFGYVLKRASWYLITFNFVRLKALLLAWQVYFIKYVMPYEDRKEAENGTI